MRFPPFILATVQETKATFNYLCIIFVSKMQQRASVIELVKLFKIFVVNWNVIRNSCHIYCDEIAIKNNIDVICFKFYQLVLLFGTVDRKCLIGLVSNFYTYFPIKLETSSMPSYM